MKATVREYTVKKKVVTLELSIEEAEDIARYGSSAPAGPSAVAAIRLALEADRASDAKEDEDVPF